MDHHYAEPHEVMYHTQLSRERLMGADTAPISREIQDGSGP